MTDLAVIQEELQDLNTLIARHERTLSIHAEAKSLRANIQTLRRKRQLLEDDFLEAATRDKYEKTITNFTRRRPHQDEG